MKNVLNWLLARLSEPNTWKIGLPALLAALGANLNPELGNLIGQAGLAFVAVIAFVMKDKATVVEAKVEPKKE